MAKEILAQWHYQIRLNSGLADYGSEDSDRSEAEQVLSFFENEQIERLNSFYEEKKADYEQFRCIYNQIAGDNEGNAPA
jgi:hypothetical protein